EPVKKKDLKKATVPL
nr:RecName: Full=100 kDa cell wall protein [Nicotiana tabacum]